MTTSESRAGASQPVSRRRFLVATVWGCQGGIALALGLPATRYLLCSVREETGGAWIDLGQAAPFQSAEMPVEVRFFHETRDGYVRRRKPCLVFVVADSLVPTGVTVLSPVCTHMACNVSWASQERAFACPCHGGRYDRSGSVLSGPPPRPLSRVTARVEGGRLEVHLNQEQLA